MIEMSYPGVGVGGLAKLDRADLVNVKAAHRLMVLAASQAALGAPTPAPAPEPPRTFDATASAAARQRWSRSEDSTPEGVAWLFSDD